MTVSCIIISVINSVDISGTIAISTFVPINTFPAITIITFIACTIEATNDIGASCIGVTVVITGLALINFGTVETIAIKTIETFAGIRTNFICTCSENVAIIVVIFKTFVNIKACIVI